MYYSFPKMVSQSSKLIKYPQNSQDLFQICENTFKNKSNVTKQYL